MQKQIVLQTAEVCLQEKPKICLIQGPPGKFLYVPPFKKDNL